MRLGLILCAVGLHRESLVKTFTAFRGTTIYAVKCVRCAAPRCHTGGASRRDAPIRPCDPGYAAEQRAIDAIKQWLEAELGHAVNPPYVWW